MRYYPQRSLHNLIHDLKKGPLPLDMIYTLARGLASGVDADHRLGFAHFDIKVC
jgi:serine/threonine protein kinase